MNIHYFSHYMVIPFETPEVIDGIKYKWYIILRDNNGKKTPIRFTSLADAREWCKRHYLEGVFYGWIKA